MGFKSKNQEQEKTMAEAMVKVMESVKAMNSRLDKVEKQPAQEQLQQPVQQEQSQQPVQQEQSQVQPQQPITKQEQPRFIVQDVPIQVEKVIVDLIDEKNPKVYDTNLAIAELLNKLTKIEKALG